MIVLRFLLVLLIFVGLVCASATLENATVFFERSVISNSFVGDYGLREFDLNGDGSMDIIAYGWASGVLAWFENPFWNETIIGKYQGIVDVDFADINDDNLTDLVIAWDLNIPPQSDQEGQIGWLDHISWSYRPIADSSNYIPGVHRVRVGNFSSAVHGVIGIPIFDYGASGPYYNQTTASIRYFPLPKNAAELTSAWPSVVLDDTLHICHTVRTQLDENTGNSFLLENSLEGVTRIDFGV